jgi:predicted 2-oxoglutarate/Fe(II)-dependent dioxygenase YbiX
VVVFLNRQTEQPESDSFCGGSLVLYGLVGEPDWQDYGFPLTGEAGLLVAFPSSVIHEVEAVTAGERYTIATWFS